MLHILVQEWILPNKKPINGDFYNCEYPSWQQDLDLHYVGITRDKKACYLVINNQRLGFKNKIVTGRDSEFLTLNGVDKYRDILIF